MAVDLHCHTKMSDGSVSVGELVLLAKQSGLSAVAVTDHDTLAGAVCAKILGDRHGFRVIPGVEVSAVDELTGKKAHILGYFMKEPEKLAALCSRTENNRKAAGMQMIKRVTQLYPVPPEMILRRAQGSTNVYKQHIMHALADAGFTREIFGPLFRELFDSRTGKAYCRVEYPSVQEAVKSIHHAGGAAVLAHPGEYDSYELLERLASNGEIEGVEVWHPRNKAGDEEIFFSVAERYGLVATGGTDFHGIYTSVPQPLGTCSTAESQVEKLEKRADAIRKSICN